MTCPDCETAATRRWHGTYRMSCIQCCARLVLSARPCRESGRKQLAAIERWLLQQSPPPFSAKDVSARARELLPAIEQQERERKANARATAMNDIRKALHDR